MSQVVKDTRRSQLVLYSIRCLIEQKRSSNFNHSQQNPPVQEKESYLARNGERKKKSLKKMNYLYLLLRLTFTVIIKEKQLHINKKFSV